MITYRIKGWDDHYENNKSRERERCSFCCIPNKQDGLGYGMLMREKDGESLYGAFVAVVLVASKQKKRKGYLTADGVPGECPLSARQLSVKCQFKESTIQRMLDVCSTNEIGWIEAMPAECPPSALEGKEGKERREAIPPAKKLSGTEVISCEKELGRVTKEMTGLGREGDYAPESKVRKRIVELRARQQELRKVLGVTA